MLSPFAHFLVKNSELLPISANYHFFWSNEFQTCFKAEFSSFCQYSCNYFFPFLRITISSGINSKRKNTQASHFTVFPFDRECTIRHPPDWCARWIARSPRVRRASGSGLSNAADGTATEMLQYRAVAQPNPRRWFLSRNHRQQPVIPAPRSVLACISLSLVICALRIFEKYILGKCIRLQTCRMHSLGRWKASQLLDSLISSGSFSVHCSERVFRGVESIESVFGDGLSSYHSMRTWNIQVNGVRVPFIKRHIRIDHDHQNIMIRCYFETSSERLRNQRQSRVHRSVWSSVRENRVDNWSRTGSAPVICCAS